MILLEKPSTPRNTGLAFVTAAGVQGLASHYSQTFRGGIMDIFVPKHEMVEARRFLGGDENEIVEWLEAKDVKVLSAFHENAYDDFLNIQTSKYEFEKALVGMWVVYHQDGRIDIVNPIIFRDRYSKVGIDGARF